MKDNTEYRKPSLATSTLVVREHNAGAQVLVVRRSPELQFWGGFWVFPGGSVEERDVSLPAAAARELHEETGLKVEITSRAANSGGLQAWARWIGPSAVPRRFDTHFYLAEAPADQRPRCDAAEICDFQWVSPRDWAFGARAGQFPIASVTQLILRELAQALEATDSVAELLETAGTRRIWPVLAKLHPADPGIEIYPWDPEYLQIRGEGIPWDREAIAGRMHWPSRMPSSMHLTN